ncbi:hypothetical protein Xekk_02146 [Xenorhabdus sp. KK7.4]|nr:hypothetical protein Xekk_02146 [Xenorhabdus sp. KK7.4]
MTLYPMDFELHRGGKGESPLSMDNYATGVSECSQQRGSLKDDGYIHNGFQDEVYNPV